jgi:hypothetical protein
MCTGVYLGGGGVAIGAAAPSGRVRGAEKWAAE